MRPFSIKNSNPSELINFTCSCIVVVVFEIDKDADIGTDDLFFWIFRPCLISSCRVETGMEVEVEVEAITLEDVVGKILSLLVAVVAVAAVAVEVLETLIGRQRSVDIVQ